MRVAILGNSGSGKSTLARWLANRAGAPGLDLDTIAWEPGQIAVPRPPEVAMADVVSFCSANEHWVVEGCYTGLVSAALAFSPRLLFLHPGEEQCLANCRSRPWEPHKYRTEAGQDAGLAFLLSWVSEYYRRDGDVSLKSHLACYSAYAGPKELVTELPSLSPPLPEAVAWAT